MPVSFLLNLSAVLIALHFALPVFSLAIAVHSSSARVMLSLKNSSLLSWRRWSVFFTCLRLSRCCRCFSLLLATALASFDSCTMTCYLLSDSKVGSLESDKMEKALCSVTMMFFVTVILLLLHFLPVTTFHPSVSLVLSFNTPHRHSMSSSGYPPSLTVNLLRGLKSISNSSHNVLGRQPLYFLFQNHLSFGMLGCGWRWLNFLQWGQSFFFFFFSLPSDSSLSFGLRSFRLHRDL